MGGTSWLRESVRGGLKPGFMLSTCTSRTRDTRGSSIKTISTFQYNSTKTLDEDISVLVGLEDDDKENAPSASTSSGQNALAPKRRESSRPNTAPAPTRPNTAPAPTRTPTRPTTPSASRPTILRPNTPSASRPAASRQTSPLAKANEVKSVQDEAELKELHDLKRETQRVKKMLERMQRENAALKRTLDDVEDKYSGSLDTIVSLQTELFLRELNVAYMSTSRSQEHQSSHCIVCHSTPTEGWSAFCTCGHELCRTCIRSPLLQECPVCREKDIEHIINVYRP